MQTSNITRSGPVSTGESSSGEREGKSGMPTLSVQRFQEALQSHTRESVESANGAPILMQDEEGTEEVIRFLNEIQAGGISDSDEVSTELRSQAMSHVSVEAARNLLGAGLSGDGGGDDDDDVEQEHQHHRHASYHR